VFKAKNTHYRMWISPAIAWR